ncbi:hypothetical protein E7681_14245 [Thalassobius vesicularis]|uniref:DUF4412 domain-containing protein n=1 Tax=Thalassobius vesicularis TaxID=1294297 RepID=A0A4S3M8E9_9RHOB|nr:hypothetical protein [Thalassobius vesicularis]THD72585.1 hypothetical protein E7681_14245 [Thalassobius vesicularis]
MGLGNKLSMMLSVVIAAAILVLAAPANAQVYLTEEEVQQITSKTNSFQGALDGVMEGEVVKFTILGPDKFAYEYVKAGERIEFTERLARAGGRKDGNPTVNFKQPDQDEVRFEFLPDGSIQFEFWEPGRRAGQTRNNPAMAKTILTISADELAPGETEITEARKEARAAATEILAVGKYKSKRWGTIIEMNADGSFSETGPGLNIKGFFIKDGNELCFDVVEGNCYDVVGPNADGVFELTYVVKKMQSQSQNHMAGQKDEYIPVK